MTLTGARENLSVVSPAYLNRFLVGRLVVLESPHHEPLRPLLPVEVHQHLAAESIHTVYRRTSPSESQEQRRERERDRDEKERETRGGGG